MIHNFMEIRNAFKQYFDDWLASFKQQDGNFFFNSYHSKHVGNHKFMTSTWKKGSHMWGKRDGRGGGVVRGFLKGNLFIFANELLGWGTGRGGGGGGGESHKIGHFFWPL